MRVMGNFSLDPFYELCASIWLASGPAVTRRYVAGRKMLSAAIEIYLVANFRLKWLIFS